MRFQIMVCLLVLGACGMPDEAVDSEAEHSELRKKRRGGSGGGTGGGSATGGGTATGGGSATGGGTASGGGAGGGMSLETYNSLIAYDIRVQVKATYLSAQPAPNFAPTPTTDPKVVSFDGQLYFHAFPYYVPEIWVSPALNVYYVRYNGISGPVSLGNKFLPTTFTIPMLAGFATTAELP